MNKQISVFQIHEIYAGWFDIKLSDGFTELFITNSDYLGNDAPKLLLENLSTLAGKEADEIWLCWHDEPGAYLWQIIKKEDTLHLSIATTVNDAFNLAGEGKKLSKEKIETVLLEITVLESEFLNAVYQAFLPYSEGAGRTLYEKEWSEFPDAAFKELEERQADFFF